MAFEAWLQDREGTYYLLKGEGGNIHVYRVDDWGRSGLGQAFHTVGEAMANEDSQEREGGGVDADKLRAHKRGRRRVLGLIAGQGEKHKLGRIG